MGRRDAKDSLTMRSTFLSFAPPDITEEEITEVADTLRSGWVTTGPRTKAFEEAFASFVGADTAIAVSSCTAALHIGLLAHGVGPGDGVAVSTLTFASAANVIEHIGATPVFVDVDADSLNVDLSTIERAIDTSPVPVKALMPVHLHGRPCELPAVFDLAASRGLRIVDDAAHALPAKIGETYVGGWRSSSIATAFSFYATKNLVTGEGGMLAGSADVVEEARRWALHGMNKGAWGRYTDKAKWRYDVDRPGFKYNLTDIQAALGLVQLKRLPQMYERRRRIVDRYRAALSGLEELQLPVEPRGSQHAWHIFAIRPRFDMLTIDRDRFITELGERNIGTSVHFIPVHTFEYYSNRYGLKPLDLPVAVAEFERLISIPMNTRLTDEDVDDVVEAVTDVVKTFRR